MFSICVPLPRLDLVLIFPSYISLAGSNFVTLGEECGVRVFENGVLRRINRGRMREVNGSLERNA
jgi:hypothetical protein